MLRVLLKWIIVLALLAAGAFYLAVGLGIAIPSIAYKGFEAHNLPAGGALLLVAVVLAVFWKVHERQTIETEEITGQSPDGSIYTSTTRTVTTDKTFTPPKI